MWYADAPTQVYTPSIPIAASTPQIKINRTREEAKAGNPGQINRWRLIGLPRKVVQSLQGVDLKAMRRTNNPKGLAEMLLAMCREAGYSLQAQIDPSDFTIRFFNPAAAPQAVHWTVTGAPRRVSQAMAGVNLESSDPRPLAEMLLAMCREAGLLNVSVNINTYTHTIQLLRPTVEAHGSLAAYLPEHPATKKAIEKASPLLTVAAQAQGGTPTISVGEEKNGIVPVTATVKHAGSRFSGGLNTSSYGPRYAGSDVVSAYGRYAGNGVLGGMTATMGLPSLTPKAANGGYYYGLSGLLEHPTPYGVIGLTGQTAIYKEGGIAQALDITGTTHLVGLSWAYPLTWGGIGAHLYYGWQNESLGVLGYSADQNFTAVQVDAHGQHGTGYKHGMVQWRASLWQGLTGHTSGVLLGKSNSTWQIARGSVSLVQPLPYGLAVQVEGGGQYGTGGIPQQEFFALGGPWRGDAYFAGSAATPSGIYGGVRLYVPKFGMDSVLFRPFVGVNGAEGAPLYGPRLETGSLDMGTKFAITHYLSGMAGYSWVIDNQGPHAYSGRAVFDLTSNW